MEIVAKVYFLKTEEGGRKSPILSGYRPALYFGDKQTDGAIIVTDGIQVLPGEERELTIRLLHPEYVNDALSPKSSFEVKEGLKVIGRGIVLKIYKVAS